MTKGLVRKTIFQDIAIILTIFTSGIYIQSPIGLFYFSYILFGILFIYFLLQKKCHFIVDKFFIKFHTVILIISFIGLVFYGGLIVSFLTAYFVFFVIFYVYWSYVETVGDVNYIFDSYLNGSLCFSVIALIQWLVFLLFESDSLILGTTITKHFGQIISVSALSAEPSNFAIALCPAACFSLYNLFVRKFTKKYVIILLAFFLTTSSLGMLGLIFFSVVYCLGVVKSRVVGFSLGLVAAFILILVFVQVDYFSDRFFGAVNLFSSTDTVSYQDTNLSTYSQQVNALIVIQGLLDRNLLGSGFGTYENTFDEYIDDFIVPSYRDTLPGRGTATSFLLRIVSEIGVFGLVFILWFIISFKIRRQYKGCVLDRFYLINTVMLATILAISVRMGIYNANGVILFFILYYFSYKKLGAQYELRSCGRSKI